MNVHNGLNKKINNEQMIAQIKQYCQQYNNIQIIVGADSQYSKRSYIFVTVVALINKGNGGIYFYDKQIKKPERKLKDKSSFIAWKVWQQTTYIIQMCNFLQQNNINIKNIKTHHDLSIDGNSSIHVPGIVGMMTGIGYQPKIKPEAFVASGIANKHTK